MDNKLLTTIQTSIKELLEDKKMSVYDLERKAGLKESVLRNIIEGRSKNPTIATLYAVASALECSVGTLISGVTYEEVQKGSRRKISWNAKLFEKSLKEVELVFKEMDFNLGLEEALFIIKEVYCFSIEQNANIPNRAFIKWLVKKTIPNDSSIS